jgi:hypothetical protein
MLSSFPVLLQRNAISSLFGSGTTAALLPLLFASMDNLYPNSNPSQSPKSHADSQTRASRSTYLIEQDLDSISILAVNRQATSNQEDGPGNSKTIQKVSAEYDGVAAPAYFDGTRILVQADDAAPVLTDEISPATFGAAYFEAGKRIAIKAIDNTPSKGDNFVVTVKGHDYYTVYGESQAQMSLYDSAVDTVSDIDLPGKYTFTAGSANSTPNFQSEFMLLGRPRRLKKMSAFFLFDSIGTAYAYNIPDLVGTSIPAARIAVPGMYIQSFNNQDNWLDLLPYATDIVIGGGTNDARGFTVAPVDPTLFISYFDTLLAKIQANAPEGTRIHIIPLMAETTSSDQFLTKANQTLDPTWPDLADALDTWIDDKIASGDIYGKIDVSPLLDPTDRHYWRTNGVDINLFTKDGYHPNSDGDSGAATGGNTEIVLGCLLPYLRSVNVAVYGADVPKAPSIVSAASSGSDVTIVINAPEYDGGASISDYPVEYSTNGGSSWAEYSKTASASTTINLTSLAGDVADYSFRVYAENSEGRSPASVAEDSDFYEIADSLGVECFIDPQDTASLTTSGSNVTKVQDQTVGNKDLAPQTSSYQPITGATIGPNAIAAIEFEGSDNLYSSSFLSSVTNGAITALVEIDAASAKTSGMAIFADGANFMLQIDEGSTNTSLYSTAFGTLTFKIDGVTQSWANRGAAYTALQSAGACVLQIEGIDFSGGFAGFFIGSNNNGASGALMTLGGLAVHDMDVASGTELTNTRNEFARRAGI